MASSSSASTAWFRACKDDDAAAISAFLARGAVEPNSIDPSGFTGLQLACFRGRAKAVAALLADPRVDADLVGPGGYTAFHFACREGKADVVALLLKQPETRLDVNRAKKGGQTGFMLAAREGREAVLRVLLENPRVATDAVDEHKNTGFILACAQNRVEAVKVLCSAKSGRIDLNAKNAAGESGFYVACKLGHAAVVHAMVVSNARIDFNSKDKDGNNGFAAACKANKYDVLEVLLAYPATNRPNNRNNAGETAFAVACKDGDKALVEWLLGFQEGLDFELADNNGDTPLHHAARLNDTALIKIFMDHLGSFDVNRKNSKGETARDVCDPPHRAQIDKDVLLHNSNYKSLLVDASEIHMDPHKTKLLGQGGYGAVFPGVFRGQQVAVKIGMNQLVDEKSKRKFEKEVNMWVALGDHENVVPLIAYCEQPLLMICPLINEKDMHVYLWYHQKDPDYWDQVYVLLRGTARGLAVMHERHLVHGDVKTANVLVHREQGKLPVAKIADFGMARVRVEMTAATSTMSADDPSGTLPFMAPELLRQMSPAPIKKRQKSDVYAFAMIAYECTTRGHEPFEGEFKNQRQQMELIERIADGYRPKRVANTPDDLWRLITKCWAHDQALRPDFVDIVKELDGIIAAKLGNRLAGLSV